MRQFAEETDFKPRSAALFYEVSGLSVLRLEITSKRVSGSQSTVDKDADIRVVKQGGSGCVRIARGRLRCRSSSQRSATKLCWDV